MKRYILILIFLGVIPFACEKAEPYFEISNLTCQVYIDDSLLIQIQPTDSLSDNQVFFKIDMAYDYVADNRMVHFFEFSPALYAFSKARPGKLGLKEKLNTIKIYSDNNFNGHVAGADIKELFKWHDVQWDGQQKPIDSLITLLNKEAFFLGNPYYLKLILNEKPIDSLEHTFSFDFIYENGKHQLTNSIKINWKK